MKTPVGLTMFGLCLVLLPCMTRSQSFIGRNEVQISHLSPDYGAAADEFVVLFNSTTDTVDLNNYEVRYFTASGSVGSAGYAFQSPTIIPPGEHLLLSNNDTVFVGAMAVLRDGPYSSGMASTGGQLVLRSSAIPDSIIFAVAWGNVTQFVAGMTDVASWDGDGMLTLVWQDSMYARTSFTYSNTEYVHIAADSISILPSMAGPASTGGSIAWKVTVSVFQGTSSDTSVVLGLDSDATDGFDPLLDLPKPPPPAGSQVHAGIYRPDLALPTGDFLLQDIRPMHPLADTAMRWFIDVFPAEISVPLGLKLDLSLLPPYLPVQVRDLQTGQRQTRIGNTLEHTVLPATLDPLRFLVVVGDTTAPAVRVLQPSADTAYVVGTSVTVGMQIDEYSGVDSLSVSMIDLRGSAGFPIIDTADAISAFTWTLPRRVLTDSAQFRITAKDSMGNSGVTLSPVFRIVPDTAKVWLSAGWHSFGVPMEPISAVAAQSLSFSPMDSVYVFLYKNGGGYRLVDSISPGKGYFIGTMSQKRVAMPGLSVQDSLLVELQKGFVLVSNPTGSPIAMTDLQFSNGGPFESYTNAVSSGQIVTGFYGYDDASGTYFAADSLKPWLAYWLPVIDTAVTMRFPFMGQAPSARVRPEGEKGWMVTIVAMSGSAVDSLFSFGTHPSATAGFDSRFDAPLPPAPPMGPVVRVYTRHPDWDTPVGSMFVRDIRSAFGGSAWRFCVDVPSGGSIHVRRGGTMGTVPRGLVIRDITGQDRPVSLNASWSYDYQGPGKRTFEVIYQPTEVNEDETVPDAFSVSQNYPNPFNGTTVFAFDVPAQGTLDVRVHDILGRIVGVVVECERVEPGRHIRSWTTDVSSGVYIADVTYRPRSVGVPQKRAIMRMILMK